jgi:prepilin-type N-terminal cleavage/methylation domain-containing protein
LNKKFKGFTLIELLVVVAIIGTIASVGIYSYNGYIKSSKKTAAKNTMMQIGVALTEFYSNSGFYWYNGLDDESSCTDEGSDAATKAVGSGLFDKENYINPEDGFNFCVIENGANFEIQAVYKADTKCMLTLDDSTVIDETKC